MSGSVRGRGGGGVEVLIGSRLEGVMSLALIGAKVGRRGRGRQREGERRRQVRGDGE